MQLLSGATRRLERCNKFFIIFSFAILSSSPPTSLLSYCCKYDNNIFIVALMISFPLTRPPHTATSPTTRQHYTLARLPLFSLIVNTLFFLPVAFIFVFLSSSSMFLSFSSTHLLLSPFLFILYSSSLSSSSSSSSAHRPQSSSSSASLPPPTSSSSSSYSSPSSSSSSTFQPCSLPLLVIIILTLSLV